MRINHYNCYLRVDNVVITLIYFSHSVHVNYNYSVKRVKDYTAHGDMTVFNIIECLCSVGDGSLQVSEEKSD